MNPQARSQAPRSAASYGKPDSGLRRRLYAIIFEADTAAGRRFDIALVAAILPLRRPFEQSQSLQAPVE